MFTRIPLPHSFLYYIVGWTALGIVLHNVFTGRGVWESMVEEFSGSQGGDLGHSYRAARKFSPNKEITVKHYSLRKMGLVDEYVVRPDGSVREIDGTERRIGKTSETENEPEPDTDPKL